MTAYATQHKIPPAADPIQIGIQRERARYRAEARLLATVAPIGRRGLAIAQDTGISPHHFTDAAARTVYCALVTADENNIIHDRTRTARLVKSALEHVGLFDGEDNRQFVHGMRWSAGAVAAIFCRLSPMEAEELLPACAAEMLALAEAA
jgi:hypothetical protein